MKWKRITQNNFHNILDDIANTTQKMKFPIKDFFSKCDQIRSFLRIWAYLLKKFLMENVIFLAVKVTGKNFSELYFV